MRLAVPTMLLVSSLVLACGRDGGGASFGAATEPSVTTVPAESESSSSGSSTSDSSSSSSTSTSSSTTATSEASTFDMGMPDFTGDPAPIGCQGKIDFLFVVSATGTMEHIQQQLLASFPKFIETIAQALPEFDVHIISAATDAVWNFDDCSYCTGESCDPQGSPPLCGAEFDECDKLLGAGVTFPVGEGASNRRCELQGGNRYIIDDEPDVSKAFTCVAQVGIDGGRRTAEAMVTALSSEFNGPTGCNTGFLRDDALLVVTLIDDGFDEQSAGTVSSWIQALRTAKHGDDDAFAVLVLTTDVDLGYWQLCLPEEHVPFKNRLRLLVEGVEHGFIGSICEETYDQFFSETVSAVVDLCDGFVPPPG